jgi:hypothetical protein
MLDLTETQETKPTAIDPQIYSKLGVSAESQEQYRKGKAAEAKLQASVETWGKDSYRDFTKKYSGTPNNFPPQAEINLVPDLVIEHAGVDRSLLKLPLRTIDLETPISSPSQVPDEIMKAWKTEMAKNPDPEQVKLTQERLDRFLRGYVNGAIENRDWQTTVNTLDAISSKDIVGNEDLYATLRPYAQQDPDAADGIANAIQARYNKRQNEQNATVDSPPIPPSEVTNHVQNIPDATLIREAPENPNPVQNSNQLDP